MKLFLFFFFTLISTSFAANFSDSVNCDYIIITPDCFIQEADTLATYRLNSTFDDVKKPYIVTLSKIYSQYLSVNDTTNYPKAYSIRSFLLDEIKRNSDLKYVVLMGKGYLEGSSRTDSNFIPSITDGYDLISQEKRISDDLFVSDLFGVKNIFPTTVITGRFSIKNRGEFYNIFNKIKKYESSKSQFKDRIILSADDDKNYSDATPVEEQSPDYICHECYSEDYLSSNIPNYIIQKKIYMQMYGLDKANYQRPDATTAFIAELNRGALFATYTGHGFSGGLAYEEFLRNYQLSKLTNINPYIFLSLTCASGDYRTVDGDSTSIIEKMTTMKYGSVVSIGAINESLGLKNAIFGSVFFKTFFSENRNYSVGELVLKAKNYVYIDDNYSPFVSSYSIFGDPATVVEKVMYDSSQSSLQGDDLILNGESEVSFRKLNDSITYSRNSRTDIYKTFTCDVWKDAVLDTILSQNLNLKKIKVKDDIYKIVSTTLVNGQIIVNIFDSVSIIPEISAVRNDKNLSDKVSVYPNPMKEFFFVKVNKYEKEKNYQIRIISLSGVEVLKQFTTSKITKISTSPFQKGSYIVELSESSKVFSKSLIYIADK